MGQFFGVILGLYMFGVFITWPVFWFKKTDRSQAPIVRRGVALGYALIWPIAVFKFFAGRRAADAAEAERRAAQSRILGDTAAGTPAGPASVPPQVIPPQANVPPASAPQPAASRIANPFDQR